MKHGLMYTIASLAQNSLALCLIVVHRLCLRPQQACRNHLNGTICMCLFFTVPIPHCAYFSLCLFLTVPIPHCAYSSLCLFFTVPILHCAYSSLCLFLTVPILHCAYSSLCLCRSKQAHRHVRCLLTNQGPRQSNMLIWPQLHLQTH
jgi:hypothetical protein